MVLYTEPVCGDIIIIIMIIIIMIIIIIIFIFIIIIIIIIFFHFFSFLLLLLYPTHMQGVSIYFLHSSPWPAMIGGGAQHVQRFRGLIVILHVRG